MSTSDADLTFLASSNMPHCRQVLDKHVVGYYTMQFMERGGVDLAYDDRWTRMEGDMWFWPAYPGPRLRFHCAPGYDEWYHRHVGFRGPLVQRWIAVGLWPTEAQPAPPGPDWPTRFDEIVSLVRRGDRWAHLRATNRLEGILIELAEARTHPEPADDWLADVLSRLTHGDAFAPDYDRVAADAGMAPSTLRCRFKAATGLSLQAYVLQARVARARALLSDTDLPLKAVAERLGYDNVYFFARQFKQQAGLPPGVFRRSRRL